jgi:hypothetical protein
MFQLTEKEKAEVVANCDHLKRLKFSPNLPPQEPKRRRIGFRREKESE